MFAQLGNIVFEGLYGFNTLNVDKGDTPLAEYELISRKTKLHKTGDSLEELTVGIKMHAKFCVPELQLKLISQYKSEGSILSLLNGDGKYSGDYIIINFAYDIVETTSDGSIICLDGTLTVRECATVDKQLLAKQEQLKNAFAVGDKQAVVTRPSQPEPVNKQIARNVSQSKMQASKVDGLVSDYENNPSGRVVTEKSIKQSCDTAVQAIGAMNDQLDEAQEVQNKFTGLRAAGAAVVDAFSGIKDRMPPENISDLKSANTYLQSVVRTFGRVSTPLMQDVILRKDE